MLPGQSRTGRETGRGSGPDLQECWGQHRGCYLPHGEPTGQVGQNIFVNIAPNIFVPRCVGNSLEVEESLECLRGGGSRDLRELVVTQGGVLLLSAGQVDSVDRGKQKIREVLDNGEAMKKFHDMIICQVSIRSKRERL